MIMYFHRVLLAKHLDVDNMHELHEVYAANLAPGASLEDVSRQLAFLPGVIRADDVAVTQNNAPFSEEPRRVSAKVIDEAVPSNGYAKKGGEKDEAKVLSATAQAQAQAFGQDQGNVLVNDSGSRDTKQTPTMASKDALQNDDMAVVFRALDLNRDSHLDQSELSVATKRLGIFESQEEFASEWPGLFQSLREAWGFPEAGMDLVTFETVFINEAENDLLLKVFGEYVANAGSSSQEKTHGVEAPSKIAERRWAAQDAQQMTPTVHAEAAVADAWKGHATTQQQWKAKPSVKPWLNKASQRVGTGGKGRAKSEPTTAIHLAAGKPKGAEAMPWDAAKTHEEEEGCAAHYGTQVGGAVCCGQAGLVGKASRVCPQGVPVCEGFIQASQWGVCKPGPATSNKDVQTKDPPSNKNDDELSPQRSTSVSDTAQPNVTFPVGAKATTGAWPVTKIELVTNAVLPKMIATDALGAALTDTMVMKDAAAKIDDKGTAPDTGSTTKIAKAAAETTVRHPTSQPIETEARNDAGTEPPNDAMASERCERVGSLVTTPEGGSFQPDSSSEFLKVERGYVTIEPGIYCKPCPLFQTGVNFAGNDVHTMSGVADAMGCSRRCAEHGAPYFVYGQNESYKGTCWCKSALGRGAHLSGVTAGYTCAPAWHMQRKMEPPAEAMLAGIEETAENATAASAENSTSVTASPSLGTKAKGADMARNEPEEDTTMVTERETPLAEKAECVLVRAGSKIPSDGDFTLRAGSFNGTVIKVFKDMVTPVSGTFCPAELGAGVSHELVTPVSPVSPAVARHEVEHSNSSAATVADTSEEGATQTSSTTNLTEDCVHVDAGVETPHRGSFLIEDGRFKGQRIRVVKGMVTPTPGIFCSEQAVPPAPIATDTSMAEHCVYVENLTTTPEDGRFQPDDSIEFQQVARGFLTTKPGIYCKVCPVFRVGVNFPGNDVRNISGLANETDCSRFCSNHLAPYFVYGHHLPYKGTCWCKSVLGRALSVPSVTAGHSCTPAWQAKYAAAANAAKAADSIPSAMSADSLKPAVDATIAAAGSLQKPVEAPELAGTSPASGTDAAAAASPAQAATTGDDAGWTRAAAEVAAVKTTLMDDDVDRALEENSRRAARAAAGTADDAEKMQTRTSRRRSAVKVMEKDYVDEVEKKLAEVARRHANTRPSSNTPSRRIEPLAPPQPKEEADQQAAEDILGTQAWWAPLEDQLQPMTEVREEGEQVGSENKSGEVRTSAEATQGTTAEDQQQAVTEVAPPPLLPREEGERVGSEDKIGEVGTSAEATQGTVGTSAEATQGTPTKENVPKIDVNESRNESGSNANEATMVLENLTEPGVVNGTVKTSGGVVNPSPLDNFFNKIGGHFKRAVESVKSQAHLARQDDPLALMSAWPAPQRSATSTNTEFSTADARSKPDWLLLASRDLDSLAKLSG
jgi:hypothetical protein